MRSRVAHGVVLVVLVAAACMATESTEVEEELLSAATQMGASAKTGAWRPMSWAGTGA